MPIVVLPVLWNVLMTGLSSIWPSRTAIDGVSIGDAWPCSTMPQVTGLSSPTSPSFSPFPTNSQAPSASRGEWESIVPLHKLTQWLCYSLMQPMQSLLKIHFAGSELLTGLPEYRNGGLFVDMGVLSLRKEDEDRGLEHFGDYCRRKNVRAVEVAPMFEPSDDVIVEWRGVTVGLLDKLCDDVNYALRAELNGGEITLGQLLEAGSWKVSILSLSPSLIVICKWLTPIPGWTRNRRSQPAKHQRGAHLDRLGRHSLLGGHILLFISVQNICDCILHIFLLCYNRVGTFGHWVLPGLVHMCVCKENIKTPQQHGRVCVRE